MSQPSNVNNKTSQANTKTGNERKVYTDEFKRVAVRLAQERGQSGANRA